MFTNFLNFLKLLEIGIYIQVYDDYEPHDLDSWVGKFMAKRKYRLEHDIPYIHYTRIHLTSYQ